MERAELARRLRGGRPAVAAARDAVVVEAREPARFRAAFAEAVAAGGTVFLANPDWGAAERAQFNALRAAPGADERAKPQVARESKIQIPKSKCEHGWLCIPTGSSAGTIKLARHDQDTLHAAVRGFAAHFGVARVNTLGVLPLHHVGGLMGWLRAELTGGTFLDGDWKNIEAGALPTLPSVNDGWFLSLVPTQLQRLLARPAAAEWLRGFRAVLVGGGPAWPELAEAGAAARVPLAFTYGATETAAAVAALRPEEFLAGGRGCGSALPHARITFDVAAAAARARHGGIADATDDPRTGVAEITVEAESLFRGYWPEWRPVSESEKDGMGGWRTGDLGFFDSRGSLRVTGRRDALIITGGEKVEPGEVETVLRATGEFADVAVVGVLDAGWGERVVAGYPAAGGTAGAKDEGRHAPDLARVMAALEKLASFKQPKKILALAEWPRDAAGKISRSRLVELVRAAE